MSKCVEAVLDFRELPDEPEFVKEIDYEKDGDYRISFGLLDRTNWVYKNRISVRLPSCNYGGRRNLFV